MEKSKFKIGDLVYAKQKTFNARTWEHFIRESKNRRGVVVTTGSDEDSIFVRIDSGLTFFFNPEDLVVVDCYSCNLYSQSGCKVQRPYPFNDYCFNVKCWQPKKERENYLFGLSECKVKATDQIKEEEKMEYKKISTINAETLLKAKPCGVPVYKSYLDMFGFKDIDDITFPSFIEFAKYRSCIKFLIDKGFIKKVVEKCCPPKEIFYNVGDVFYCKTKLTYYMLARLSSYEAVLISIPYGNRWSKSEEVKWLLGAIGRISEADFNRVANNHAFKLTKVNDKTKVYDEFILD